MEKITRMIVELEIEEIQDVVKEVIKEQNVDSLSLLRAIMRGMEEVGKKYENKEYYLAELVLAAETTKIALEIITPILSKNFSLQEREKIILCTVKGDHHDIGKNLLGTLLRVSGFQVIDLGTDVDASTIVSTVYKTNARIIALSTLLTTTAPQIKNIHEKFKEEGLRDKVKLIVGGASVNAELARQFGADMYGEDVLIGVKKIKKLSNLFSS